MTKPKFPYPDMGGGGYVAPPRKRRLPPTLDPRWESTKADWVALDFLIQGILTECIRRGWHYTIGPLSTDRTYCKIECFYFLSDDPETGWASALVLELDVLQTPEFRMFPTQYGYGDNQIKEGFAHAVETRLNRFIGKRIENTTTPSAEPSIGANEFMEPNVMPKKPGKGATRAEWFRYKYECDQSGTIRFEHADLARELVLAVGTVRNYYSDWLAENKLEDDVK